MVALVTGASRGIGYALVQQYAVNGFSKVYAISRNTDRLKQLKHDTEKLYPETEIVPVPADLSGDFQSFLKKFIPEDEKIDVLVNNAGALVAKPFASLTDEDFTLMFEVNVKAVFSLSQFLLPYYNTGAHIVNISSMGGVQGSVKFSGLSLYSASKGAVSVLTESMAEELKETGIKVNCLALGAVQTEMLAEAFPGFKAPVLPDQMARFICDFSISSHKFLNGKVIPVSLSTP